jgi:acyl carrier protein
LYKTGDLARYRADGNVEFVGRNDAQVKLRGFRVELGEIEAVLRRQAGVKECVVVVREEEGNKQLVSYVVGEAGAELSIGELRKKVELQLPGYMVPGAWVLLDKLPVTPNGKVDRWALPAPSGKRESGTEYVAPRTPAEVTIAGIMAEVLGIKEVGVCDDFFQLGGHSLMATQIVSRVRTAFDLEVPLRSFFETPTVRGLTEAIARAEKKPCSARGPRIERIEPATQTTVELNALKDEELDALLNQLLTEKNTNV